MAGSSVQQSLSLQAGYDQEASRSSSGSSRRYDTARELGVKLYVDVKLLRVIPFSEAWFVEAHFILDFWIFVLLVLNLLQPPFVFSGRFERVCLGSSVLSPNFTKLLQPTDLSNQRCAVIFLCSSVLGRLLSRALAPVAVPRHAFILVLTVRKHFIFILADSQCDHFRAPDCHAPIL